MPKTDNTNRLRRVAMHDAVDGVWLAQMVRKVFMPVSNSEEAGVHNEYVSIIGDLLPENDADNVCIAISKAILEIARKKNG